MMFRGRGGSPPLAEALRGGRKAVGRVEKKMACLWLAEVLYYENVLLY